jgi:hypothetical protein
MAVLDAPRHEAEGVARLERRVQAQLFLDVLQGAFESAWERPEDLQRALAELPSTVREEGRRRVLISYLEAMRGCLREGPEAGKGEAGTRAQGRRKRRLKPRRRGSASGSDQEGSENEVRSWVTLFEKVRVVLCDVRYLPPYTHIVSCMGSSFSLYYMTLTFVLCLLMLSRKTVPRRVLRAKASIREANMR